jgi:hypothetical protein
MPEKKWPLAVRDSAQGLIKQQRKLNIPAQTQNVKPPQCLTLNLTEAGVMPQDENLTIRKMK